MNPEEQRANVVRYWWSKAEESLASAQREFAAGSYTFAVNRLYYAAFYGACAALLERRQSFRKHSGVRAAFHREFIRTRLLDVKWGKLYDHLFEDRQEGDYIALIAFEPRVCGISNRALQGVPPLITSLDIYLILKLPYGSMLSYCPPPIEAGAV